MSKIKWRKPKLIVLVRGRPDEAVLQAYKLSGWGPTGPEDFAAVCEKGVVCAPCYEDIS